ncbi:MAG: hypothetical protein AAGJ46_14060 [Planctomycetota bacterium]
MTTLPKPLSAALLLAIAAAAPCLAQSDRVRTRSGTESGKITKITPLEVTIERGRKTTAVKVNEIESLQFGGEPSELSQARVNARNGGYKLAMEKLAALDASSLSNPFVKADAQFYKAFCQAKLALLGDASLSVAGRGLNDFLRQNPRSYHYLAANELLGDLLASAGRYPQAAEYYKRLGKAPFPDFKVRAGVLLGKTLQSQDKHAEAIKQFDAALAIQDDGAAAKAQRQAAQLGKAVSLAATGDVKQGLADIQSVLNDCDPAEEQLLASAYNALGSCYLQAGKKKDALYAFLHVDLIFPSVAEAHAESLFNLATLWEEVGKAGKAREARNELQSRYAASTWAKRL